MREIDASKITEEVARLARETNLYLCRDVKEAIQNAQAEETGEIARGVLDTIGDNIEIAAQEKIPLCQDTGMACVFVYVGQDVHIMGRSLKDAINEGVRQGYEKGFLRKSIVADPIRRGNTGDNTPARIVYEIVPGENIDIWFAPKGFGSENMSRIKMLPPAAGRDGIVEFVLETVKEAGGNPCPPIVVGVGIGSNFDGVALLAKKALLLPVDESNEDSYYAELETELLEKINGLGIGPQGFGGDTTALAVRVLAAPTHIAGMPVAVNINCHLARHGHVTL